MSSPALHVLAGPNGSGKTTFALQVLKPVTGLEFVNADMIAAGIWPGQEEAHAYAALKAAAANRDRLLEEGRSFIARPSSATRASWTSSTARRRPGTSSSCTSCSSPKTWRLPVWPTA